MSTSKELNKFVDETIFSEKGLTKNAAREKRSATFSTFFLLPVAPFKSRDFYKNLLPKTSNLVVFVVFYNCWIKIPERERICAVVGFCLHQPLAKAVNSEKLGAILHFSSEKAREVRNSVRNWTHPVGQYISRPILPVPAVLHFFPLCFMASL